MTTADPYEDIINDLGKAKANGHAGGQHGKEQTGDGSEAKKPALNFDLDDWNAEEAYAGEAQRIRWLVSSAIPAGVAGIVAAAGDTGKSYLLLELCERVARGFRQDMLEAPIFGGSVTEHGTAVFITAEDSKASVHRRLKALDPDRSRLAKARAQGSAHPLHVIPLPDAGGPFPIVEQARGKIIATAQYQELREKLLAIPNPKLVVLDPLQAFVLADVNADPMAAQFVCSLLARLAAETGATVLAAHHVRKAAGPPRTPEEARQAIRGSSALVDGVRVAITLWQPAEAEARKACRVLETDFAPSKVACGAVVKTNDGACRKVWTLIRGENGLLVDRTNDIAIRSVRPEELLRRLEEGVAQAAKDGRPFTKMGENGVHKRRFELPDELHAIGRNKLEAMVDDLEQVGRIVKAMQGGTTVKWLDVPDGPFARGEGDFAPGASTARPERKVNGSAGDATDA